MLQSMGSRRVGHDLVSEQQTSRHQPHAQNGAEEKQYMAKTRHTFMVEMFH